MGAPHHAMIIDLVLRLQSINLNSLPWDLILVGAVAALAGLILGMLLGSLLRRQSKGGAKKAATPVSKGERGNVPDRDRLHAIYNLISALSSSLNYQRILDNVLDLTAGVLNPPGAPTDYLVSAVLLFSKGDGNSPELSIGSARRFAPTDLRLTLPGKNGLLGEVIEEGGPSVTQHISKDPELSRILALGGCRSAYSIPLRAGLDTYGVLLFAHPRADYFTPDRKDVLEIVAHQAVIAIQNARLYKDLELEKERIQEIQEEARKKLARDLHDGPTQSVAAIAMRVNYARRLMERDQKGTVDELIKVEDLARRTTKEIRHMLFTLRPLVLESQGLIAALEALADKMRETYNQDCIIQADAKLVPDLEMSKQAVIFYIAEEAVTNARKHAQAAHVWIRLKPVEKDVVLLEIEDDGVGFNVGAVDAYYNQRGSLGMVNMRERAEMVNGLFHIDSAEGKGARIQVVIPLSEEAADHLRNGK